MFWSLFGHSTWELASVVCNDEQGDLFYSAGLRQTQENCREQKIGIYTAFVDLTGAFDTVSRDGLWKILARLGCFSPSSANSLKVSKVR